MFEEFEKKENVDLKNLSTMKVGGLGRYLIFPKNYTDLKKILEICKKNAIKTLILGNGSNILFLDEGFGGAIISLKYFNEIKFVNVFNLGILKYQKKIKKQYKYSNFSDKNKSKKMFSILKNEKKYAKNILKLHKKTIFFEIGAGINLFCLNLCLKDFGASGLEWSYGIPATLGGLIFMNGGCFGHEISELVEEVLVLFDGQLKKMKKRDLEFSYRSTKLKNMQNCVIVSAKLRLFCEKSEKIEKNMNYYFNLKKSTQPCELPSLGSVFKKICDISPAKIIDELDLKGLTLGGAQVSYKHAGFIVNIGGAKSNEILMLIKILQQQLLQVGLLAECEIVIAR